MNYYNIPKKIIKPAVVCCVALLAAAMICFAAAAGSAALGMRIAVKYSYVAAGSAFIIIGAAITQRYIICHFSYALENGTVEILKSVFYKKTLMCKINISYICELRLGSFNETISPENEVTVNMTGKPKIKKRDLIPAHGRILKYADYCQNMFPPNTAALIFDDGYGKKAFCFEPDNKFIEILGTEIRAYKQALRMRTGSF